MLCVRFLEHRVFRVLLISVTGNHVAQCSLDLARCPELNLKCFNGASLCKSLLYILKELGEKTEKKKSECVLCHVGRAVSTEF